MESTAMVGINSAGNEVCCDMHILYFCLSQNQFCSLNLNVIDTDEKLQPKENTYLGQTNGTNGLLKVIFVRICNCIIL